MKAYLLSDFSTNHSSDNMKFNLSKSSFTDIFPVKSKMVDLTAFGNLKTNIN